MGTGQLYPGNLPEVDLCLVRQYLSRTSRWVGQIWHEKPAWEGPHPWASLLLPEVQSHYRRTRCECEHWQSCKGLPHQIPEQANFTGQAQWTAAPREPHLVTERISHLRSRQSQKTLQSSLTRSMQHPWLASDPNGRCVDGTCVARRLSPGVVTRQALSFWDSHLDLQCSLLCLTKLYVWMEQLCEDVLSWCPSSMLTNALLWPSF